MKRRRLEPTLFEPTPPNVYLFDTSAWLNIESLPNKENIWALVGKLVDEGRICTCHEVIPELRDDPVYERRIKPMEKTLLAGCPNSSDIPFLQRVGRITHDHPSMSKATSAKNPADPFVVALAQVEGYTVVADESKNRPSRKIPGVCAKLKIPCITLKQFIKDEVK
jgi:hypothetical protein